MPTLEAPIQLEDRVAFDVLQELTVPSSDESRTALQYFEMSIEQDFLSSEFWRVQRRYMQLRSSLIMQSKLRDDWNSYGAESPSPRTIELTLRLLNRLRHELLLPVRLVPSAEGGIAAYFKADDRVSYLEYRNSGEVILARYDQRSEPDVRELSETDVDESTAIALIREHIRA